MAGAVFDRAADAMRFCWRARDRRCSQKRRGASWTFGRSRFERWRRAARRADLVHVHDARAHTMAALAGVAPLVVSRRVAFPVKSGFLSGRKYARATLYLAVSNYVAARLLDAGVPGDKIRVVYDGVPISGARTAAARPGGGAGVQACGDSGRFCRTNELIYGGICRRPACSFIRATWKGWGRLRWRRWPPESPWWRRPWEDCLRWWRTGRPVSWLGTAIFKNQSGACWTTPRWPRRCRGPGGSGCEREFSVEGMVEKTMRAYREVLG